MAQLDRIRDSLARRTFERFSIKMTDGTAGRVAGPRWLFVPPVPRPREVAFVTIPERGEDDEFHAHGLELAPVAQVVGPGIPGIHGPSERAGDPK